MQIPFVKDIWPISQAAGIQPDGWPGWPDGKEFALVLTHDVESQCGLDKVKHLAELEMRLGFRSSFNFIPKGEYRVPAELRAWLVEHGFEVGVHDLHHDGRLFSSREHFQECAQEINLVLKEWGSAGFRAGFMLRNLDWLRDLQVEYDSSTFDVDPFEPQPDGVNTIFPFEITRDDGSRFVELPYTLPQDSTLHLLRQNGSTRIWEQKLNWVASKGGLALVNVHPDYVTMERTSSLLPAISERQYEEFLVRQKAQWNNDCWWALPKDVARWTLGRDQESREYGLRGYCAAAELSSSARKEQAGRGLRQREAARSAPVVSSPSFQPLDGSDRVIGSLQSPSSGSAAEIPNEQWRLKGKRAAVALFSYYPADPRPRRAAEAMVRAGVSVELVCLREGDEPAEGLFNGVRITRLPIKRRRAGKLAYVWQYGAFIALAALILGWRSLWRRFHLVHVHNMPDVLVLSALIPKVFGAKVILDLHDPMPELMMAIFGLQRESRSVRFMKSVERASIWIADLVLTPNQAFKKVFVGRSCPADKVVVVMNSPDEAIFPLRPIAPSAGRTVAGDRRFIVMYHGSLVERHGLDLAVDAIQKLLPSIPGLELRIYGASTPFIVKVMDSVKSRGLDASVYYLGGKSLEEISGALDDCDLGIIPNRRSTFTELNMPTRIFEYLSRGKPVVAPRSEGIQDYFGEDEILFFELGQAADLASKIAFAFRNPDDVRARVLKGQDIYRRHLWSAERRRLLTSVAGLLAS